ncbi:MAG TPA: carboxypeptidase regulatory-like domain-containing protein [Blastocatellia bacterium]|nr:carboxypeptidase regulatory-like domain-containing protein [Blastocatellia bacterium]
MAGNRHTAAPLRLMLCLTLLVFLIAFALCVTVPATAQASMATLSGSVMDETEAAVSDVMLSVMNTETGLRRKAVTNRDGYFVFPLLPAGSYTLTAEMQGFAPVTVNDITLEVSANSQIQIVLKPKAVAETIDVTAEDSVESSGNRVDITAATTRHTINNKQVSSLPIFTSDLGRNALSVLPFLVPGVSPTTVFGSGRSDSNRFGNQMSINGGRPAAVSFYLEDGDNNDEGLDQAASPLPNPDALRELAIITNNYQADLGRSSGGILNAVLKSGTNKYAGNLRYFVVNEALNARGFFDNEVPLDRLNTFGGQAGGPVKPQRFLKGMSRTFFFFDYEGTRSGRETLSTLSLLTAKERAGDFSENPRVRPSDPLTRRAFPDNIIPADRLDPIARAYLDQYVPLPNNGDRGFSRLLLTRFRTGQIAARIDSNVGRADSLSATFLSTLSAIDVETPTLPVGSNKRTDSTNQNLVLRETHIFSTRVINQLTFALTRFVSDEQNFSPGATDVAPREFGFTGVHPQSDRFLGIPSVSITGTDVRVSTGGGSNRSRVGWQIKDDISQSFGNHSLKFGAEARRFSEHSVVGSDNGNFSFVGVNPPFGTRNAIADFLLGLPFTFSQRTDNQRHPRKRSYHLYAMSDWHALSNLTVNLGLRYELSPPIKDELDQVSAFRPGATSERFPRAPAGLLFVGDTDPVLGRLPRGLFLTDKNNFAPRIGVAYSPEPDKGLLRLFFGKGETAIRVGGGLFYDHVFGPGFARVSSTQPFSVSQTLDAQRILATGGTFANPFGTLPSPWPLDLSKRAFIGIPDLQPIDPHFRSPYTYQYNLTLQRELPGSVLFEAAYIGSNSFKLIRQIEINEALIEPGASLVNIQSRRKFRRLGSILQQESTGRARYDSLQLAVKRKLKSGLLIDGSYVYGKSLDDGSSPLSVPSTNPFRWARSSYNRTHNFAVSYSYDIPSLISRGVAGRMLDGWQASGITEIRSGLPMDIAQSIDTTLTGRSPFGNPDIVRPFVRLDPRNPQTIVVAGATQTGNYFFDPGSFRAVTGNQPPQIRAGTLGRNAFDGPGLSLTSLSIVKKIRLTESHQILLRSDIRNLFNQANFDAPSLLADNPFTFGKVTRAAPGRNVQLSLKYLF